MNEGKWLLKCMERGAFKGSETELAVEGVSIFVDSSPTASLNSSSIRCFFETLLMSMSVLAELDCAEKKSLKVVFIPRLSIPFAVKLNNHHLVYIFRGSVWYYEIISQSV